MIGQIAEVIVYGFATIGFIIVACLALGATEVVAEGIIKDRQTDREKEAQSEIWALRVALRQARQPEHILLPAMKGEYDDC
jgi:hypothetical protein